MLLCGLMFNPSERRCNCICHQVKRKVSGFCQHRFYVLRMIYNKLPLFHYAAFDWFFKLKHCVCLCVVRPESLHIMSISFGVSMAVLWLRTVVVALSPRRAEFLPSPLIVRSVFDIVALRQVCHRIRRFSAVSVITRMLSTHLHLNTVIMKRGSGRSQ